MIFRAAIFMAILSAAFAMSAEAQEMPYVPPHSTEDGQLACWHAYDNVGQLISSVSGWLSDQEKSRIGGTLTFDQAEHIRNVIYTRSYASYEAIRDIEADGDAQKCYALQDQSKQIIKGVIIELAPHSVSEKILDEISSRY